MQGPVYNAFPCEVMIVNPLLAFFSPGPGEMLVIGILAVLLFGKRLPEVGRSLGKGLVEFKKGLHGIEDDLDSAGSGATPSYTPPRAVDYAETTAPKFEPPTHEPRQDPAG